MPEIWTGNSPLKQCVKVMAQRSGFCWQLLYDGIRLCGSQTTAVQEQEQTLLSWAFKASISFSNFSSSLRATVTCSNAMSQLCTAHL